MAKEIFQLVSDEQITMDTICYKIEHNLITKEDVQTMTDDEKVQLNDCLFHYFSKNVNVYRSLKALEFALFGIAKLYFRGEAPAGLTETEQEYYNIMKTIVENHESKLDTTDPGFVDMKLTQDQVVANRDEYEAKRTELIG